MSGRRALVIGIDDYPGAPLQGCVNDARAIGQLLETHGNGDRNFDIERLTSDEADVSAAALQAAIEKLFRGDADTAVLFFAGHGIINRETNAGFIVSSDGKKPGWGVSLHDILHLANSAYPHIKSSVIILDSCHSGFAGEVAGLKASEVSVIGTGVTILTASHREGVAEEGSHHGLFTEILLDGLRGGCASISGDITPASLYSHVDQTLGAFHERPVYKANVHSFISLRKVPPKVPLEVLKRLPTYFPSPAHEYQLNPSFEPEREMPAALKDIPVNPDNARVFKELQQCNRHGLVVPVDADHMYHAAINSKACKLTAIGAHYRKLAAGKRL